MKGAQRRMTFYPRDPQQNLTSTIKPNRDNKNLLKTIKVHSLKEFDYFNAPVKLKGYPGEKKPDGSQKSPEKHFRQCKGFRHLSAQLVVRIFFNLTDPPHRLKILDASLLTFNWFNGISCKKLLLKWQW